MKVVTITFIASFVMMARAQESESLLQTWSMKESCAAPKADSCVLWNMTQQVAGIPDLVDPAWKVHKIYEVDETAITANAKDAAWLYKKCGHCQMVFRATDSGDLHESLTNPSGDWGNNLNFTLIDKWGLSGVHAGVAAELEGLLALMDFQDIRAECPESFSVAGHSLGGALAQLVAVLLTNSNDPLDANLNFLELNTFGSFAAMQGPASNNQSGDGCFAGTQSWYAQTMDGVYAVDTVNQFLVGAHLHDPVQGSKVFMVPELDGTMSRVEYPCGTPLPSDSVDLLEALLFDGASFFLLHENYSSWLSCGL